MAVNWLFKKMFGFDDVTGVPTMKLPHVPHATVSSPLTQTPALNNMWYPVLFEDDDDVNGDITRRSGTVTINNSTPAKCTISWASHGLAIGGVVRFTTTGGLPTGLTVGTNYYIATTNFTANSFELTDLAGYTSNAPASTIVTTSAGSGVHTCICGGRLYIGEAGHYEIILSTIVAAVDNTDVTTDIWFVRGTAADTAANTSGTNVPKSDTQVRTTTTGQRLVLSVAIILDMEVGDFIRLAVKTSVGAKSSLLAVAAVTTDGVALPAMPSSILSISKILS